MFLVKDLDWKRLIVWSEWEKVVLVMAATCGMPFVWHALPWMGGPELGMRWLPMYYAPLLAAICFRPHVFLVVGIVAPVLNHVVFGMPSDRVLPMMVFELLALNAAVSMISARASVRGWHVLGLFMALRAIAVLVFLAGERPFMDRYIASCAIAWPGVVLLAVLAEAVGRYRSRGER